ncbi:peptide deformylase [Paracoccus luteus]|uniref:peptide deformylase n=1 Tax=Paracoccus luteus TaxID=2508543 RepID=UPI001FEBC0FA|nr:peptide deformylase [Paracoccus luteus]
MPRETWGELSGGTSGEMPGDPWDDAAGDAILADLPPGSVRAIVMHPDPVLRQICRPAGELTFLQLQALVGDLFATLYAAQGRGLAAPQIGRTRRAFVMDAGWKTGAPRPRALLEPVLLWQSTEMATAEELCLSIPGRPVAVARPVAVRIGWFDLDGRARAACLSGAEARIALHEMDHLDGRLILDADPAGPADPARTPGGEGRAP